MGAKVSTDLSRNGHGNESASSVAVLEGEREVFTSQSPLNVNSCPKVSMDECIKPRPKISYILRIKMLLRRSAAVGGRLVPLGSEQIPCFEDVVPLYQNVQVAELT